jgi:hypothetical protein
VTGEALAPGEAPKRLMELSEDVRAAVLLDRSGEAAGCTEPARTEPLSQAARDLVRAVDRVAEAPTAELEAQVAGGGVYLVRSADWTFVVVARRSALSSLMLYDMRAVLTELAA